jgi:L-lactate utilization protein LutB
VRLDRVEAKVQAKVAYLFLGLIKIVGMKLSYILRSERTKSARKMLLSSFDSYLGKRRVFESELPRLRERLRELKERSVSNLKELKEELKLNLEHRGIEVQEARDGKEAFRKLLKLIPKGKVVVKAKSSTLNEIGIERLEDRNEVVETDCGDFMVRLCKERPSHPVTPAMHIPLNKIVQSIEQRYGNRIEAKPEAIVGWFRQRIRESILRARVGLTGANALSADGSIFLVENEGNISLVSRIPETHVIVAGIEKIVPTVEDAMLVCRAQCIWGLGAGLPSYLSVISSPSKTADLKRIVYGVSGARKVHLILLDNGRSELIQRGLGELLYCINCGACLYFCPIYRQILDSYGASYLGGRGVCMAFHQIGPSMAFERGLFFCTTCRACKNECPVGIDIPGILVGLRREALGKGLWTEAGREMIQKVREHGNPFGKIERGKLPERLFCC